jgi:uncharacterized protein with NAD-binding domain and iron-sulfur cluster
VTQPIKVAVVGGGCAGMAAAFELSRPEHRGRYQVTVYQLGWRLGGKGASGRRPDGRIEEHGLHFWMGFYENAFRLMRECYTELARDPATYPIADWRDAFAPAPSVGVADRAPGGPWHPWIGHFGRSDGLPGDPNPPGVRWTVADYVQRLAGLARILLESLAAGGATRPSGPAAAAEDVTARVIGLLQYGEMATLAAMVEAVALLEVMTGSLARYPDSLVLRFLNALGANARRQLEVRATDDVAARRLWAMVDITFATLRGIVRFGLLTDPRGFDAIDEYDCREWLALNGASQESVDGAYMRGLYDLVFAYEDGDVSRPRVSAAQALRSWVRAFAGYRGSFFWTMQAGMGDIVFAPFYEVLARRGVRFAFFHRLENVSLSAPGDESPHVTALEFDVQAEVRGGRPYAPLVDVDGLPCWPASADWSQLVDGERLRQEGWEFESHWDRRKAGSKTLQLGVDFDLVVLAIGIGAVPHVCREIVARDPRWRAMVDHVKTVATQAAQLWLSADLAALGWPHRTTAVSGFVEPFQTWADMGQVLPREGWREEPRALVYLCGVLPDEPAAPGGPEFLAAQYERVRRNVVVALDRDLVQLWPAATAPAGGFRWELLVAPDAAGAVGAVRLQSQYWRANVNPTDRYTLSLPGSSAYRISPLDETYDNLTIAGDWTDCGLNAGCVEAAVMSGRLAAHAISQAPALEDIVGFDHP